LLGLKSRSEEGTRPPEPTACESGIRVRSLNATTECEIVPAIDQNAREARPRIEGFEQPEAKLMKR
jgi:hypothetical protein